MIGQASWVMDLTPELEEEISAYPLGTFLVVSPYATPRGEVLDEFCRRPGFATSADHPDGGLMTTPEMRELMAGMIGTHNIAFVSGGVVVPIRDGIDLPISDRYRVRVENDYGADMFIVSRVHIVGGQERIEGEVETDFIDVGKYVHRAGCYVNWNETEWTVLGDE